MKEYDVIAGDWNKHRTKPISALALFIGEVKKTDIMLDAGCGNARNLIEIARRCRKAVGMDSSKKMLEFAAGRINKAGLDEKTELVCADVCALPFYDGEFDKVFCLAVLHHLPKARRLKAFREIARVLKKGGRLYVSEWNRDQKKFDGMGERVRVPWKMPNGSSVNRRYYLSSEKEMALLAEKTGLKVEKVIYEKNGREHAKRGAKNLCLRFAKPRV